MLNKSLFLSQSLANIVSSTASEGRNFCGKEEREPKSS